MGLSTYRHHARAEIEIGTWGTACTVLLFLISWVVESFTSAAVAWIDGLACIVGIGTITAIVLRGYASDSIVRARKALRKRRRDDA
jgi:hypothetical protein